MSSPVFFFDHSDPAMAEASAKARQTFRYFWREVAWEYRRIVPGLEVAAVKASFSDADDADESKVEHMWLGDVDFDGEVVEATLLNEPNWLRSVSQGQRIAIPRAKLGDWMYALQGRVYGAYTVNLMRSQMSRKERKQHDAAWGFDFGDPLSVEVVPGNQPTRGMVSGVFGKAKEATLDAEHPMSVNMAPKLREQLAADPSQIDAKDSRGWTLLHDQALAGSLPTVQVLLELGADPAIETPKGKTARDLAASLGWSKVVELL